MTHPWRGENQLAGKYLPSESWYEGYLVIFDTQTPVGKPGKPKDYPVGNKTITVIVIGIGRE